MSSHCIGKQQTPSTDTAAKSLATRFTGFSIPFKIDDPNGSYIEVQLYVSSDRGQSWKFHDRRNITDKEFNFKSDGDGEYWFALKTLDRNRQLIPPGNVVRPELRVIVDTVKPTLDFRVDSDAAGRIVAGWKVTDVNIDPATLKISLRETGASESAENWSDVAFRAANPSLVQNSWADELAFWPQKSAPNLEVRLELADAAGNSVSAVRTTTVRPVSLERKQSGSTTTQRKLFDTPANVSADAGRIAGKNADVLNKEGVCHNGICQPADIPTANSQLTPHPPVNNKQAMQLPGQGRGVPTKQVGSQRELVAPPQPDTQIRNAQNAAAAIPPNNSRLESDPVTIPWESKINQWTGRNDAKDASTLINNQFPSAGGQSESVALQQRFQNVPVVNRKPNLDQMAVNSPSESDSSASEQGNFVVSESTAVGRGTVQRTDVPLSADVPSPTSVERVPQIPQFQNDSPFVLPQQINNQNSMPQISSAVNAPPANPPRSPNVSNAGAVPQLNVNTRRFNLNYDIRAIDPSGVGLVILWATEDAGRTWRSWATDTDNTSPFPVEVKAEGTYGFRVVINSRDGLIGKAPVSGDPPDVMVQVDLTVPQVAITSAPFGSGPDVGKLIIQFNADDQYLALRPIMLAYSPDPTGPWTKIESGLRNTGSYAWKVPSQVPEQIYLRIEARDTSGNVGAFQLTAPIDISGLAPRGRIYSVDPIN